MSNLTAIELKAEAEAEVVAALEQLTETQRRRVLKRVSGSSLAQIAEEEGRAVSTIDESLKAPGVQGFFSILGVAMRAHKRADGTEIHPILASLTNIADIAHNAMRAVVVGDGNGHSHVQMVPDYPTRLAASAKLISLVDKKPEPPPIPAAGVHNGAPTASASETLELEQTQTTRRRLRVSQTRK